jgi:hypothetical protein
VTRLQKGVAAMLTEFVDEEFEIENASSRYSLRGDEYFSLPVPARAQESI